MGDKQSRLDDILAKTIKRANDLDEFADAKELFLFKDSKAEIKALMRGILVNSKTLREAVEAVERL